MQNITLEIGQHAWALSNNELLVVLKTPEGYEVCGAWEGGIGDSELEILDVISEPKGFENHKLYYSTRE